MSKNVVKDKSLDFAIKIEHLSKVLTSDKKEFNLSKQLLRSGTSVGAMVREAEHAESNQILSTSWQLLRRKSMKVYTGWSCFLKPSISLHLNMMVFGMKLSNY